MTDKLTIAAYRCNANGGTQVTIEQTNDEGQGWGRRLAGPKHYNLGTQTLVKADLDADDAREIRRMLDEVFPDPEVAKLRAELAELRKTPAERANERLRALREAGDIEGAIAAAEAYEASVAWDVAHPRI